MATPWASLSAYGLTAHALQAVLPVEATLHATTVQHHPLHVAPRGEDELGEEPWAVVAGGPADWGTRPRPDGPLTVGIDGGDVRNWEAQQPHVAVLVGKRMLACRRDDAEEISSRTCVGVVPTRETKPTRRRFAVLPSQGQPMNQPRTCLSAGGDTVRALQRYLNPQAEHRLEWVPLALRLTVMQQTANGLPQTLHDAAATSTRRDPVVRSLARRTWSRWPGNVDQAFPKRADLELDRDVAVANTGDGTGRTLLRAVEEFHPDSERKRAVIPNDGARSRDGERMRTGCVESTVTQVSSRRFCKQPPRQWTTRGAHRLWHTRVNTLKQALGAVFQRWYPDVPLEEEPLAA